MTPWRRNPDMVADYLAGRLSEADAQAFEEQCGQDPGLVRAVEDTLRLREGLATLHAAGVLDSLRRRRLPWSGRQVGAVAATLAAIALLVGVPLSTRPALVSATVAGLGTRFSAAPSVSATYSFALMRQAPREPRLALPERGALELRMLAPDSANTHSFATRLDALDASGSSTVVGSLSGVAPGEDGFVSLFVDASRIKPGRYRLTLASLGSANVAEDHYSFVLAAVPGDVAP
jgi:hypothetical protein